MRISDWSSDVCSSDLCDRSLVAAAITHDEHRRPRPARAGMFLIDDPRRLEREVARLEPAARQVPAISQDHPERVAAMVMERVDAVPPVERLARDRPDPAALVTRPHYRLADIDDACVLESNKKKSKQQS